MAWVKFQELLTVSLTALKLISNLVEYPYFVAFRALLLSKLKKYQQSASKYVFLTWAIHSSNGRVCTQKGREEVICHS